MKTKNAPKDLKCKTNHTFFFFGNRGSQKGGGVRHLGKIPKKSRFFLGWRPLFQQLIQIEKENIIVDTEYI